MAFALLLGYFALAAIPLRIVAVCFQLYAATGNQLPRRKWEQGSFDLPVESLTEQEAPIKYHFNNPEIQFIGSTSGCGCDFPYLIFQGGGWPSIDDLEVDREQSESDRVNREGLVRILRSAGDPTIELYGIWDGDFDKAPAAFEDISLEAILGQGFCFKERGFYRVRLNK